jgi:hypothetical protein
MKSKWILPLISLLLIMGCSQKDLKQEPLMFGKAVIWANIGCNQKEINHFFNYQKDPKIGLIYQINDNATLEFDNEYDIDISYIKDSSYLSRISHLRYDAKDKKVEISNIDGDKWILITKIGYLDGLKITPGQKMSFSGEYIERSICPI